MLSANDMHQYNATVRRNVFLAVQIVIMLMAITARVVPGPRTIDDAYITYRYAGNLLDGHGLVYNVGERVLGTTTPLYTLTLAGLGFLLGGSNAPFPWISLLLNAVADAVTCLLLIGISKRLGYLRSGIAAAALWAVAPWSVSFAIGGMETSFIIALMTGTFYFYSEEKPVPVALLASLSLLTRPDSLLFIAPILIDRIRKILPKSRLNPTPSRVSLQEVLAFILPSFAWFLFATTYYGKPLPNSISAKVVAYSLESHEAFIRLLQHYATPFLGHLTFGNSWIVVGLILYTTLFFIGMITAFRAWNSSWAIFVFPVIYFLAFSIANPLIFRWYLSPPLPIFFIGIFLGMDRITQDLHRNVLFWLLTAIAFLLTLNGWTIKPDHGPSRPAPEMAFIRLELLYEQVGKDLKKSIEPNQTLAAGDIGALGYFTKARILDTVGLISPRATSYYPLPDSDYVINYAIPTALILGENPDYFVTLEVYGRNTFLTDSNFRSAYRLINKYETDLYGSDGMLVFQWNNSQ
jgi:arabinofuranosyltransferase